MKYLLLLALFATQAWSKPLVLVSYFDAFGTAKANNSERVALEIAKRLNTESSAVEIKLCALKTIFDVSYAQIDECLKALPAKPVLVIGLGEATCQLKVETMMRNLDKTRAPDNAGNERSNTPIIHGAEKYLGMRYPLAQMYCSLSERERADINVSNDAGSFVCNNTAFQMSYYHPELQYGFIHVPANNCQDLNRKTLAAVTYLEKMILSGVKNLTNDIEFEGLPHSSNEIRLPTQKDELRSLRRNYSSKNKCIYDFLKKI